MAVLGADGHLGRLSYKRHGNSCRFFDDASFLTLLWIVICCALVLWVSATTVLLLMRLDTLSTLDLDRVKTHANGIDTLLLIGVVVLAD